MTKLGIVCGLAFEADVLRRAARKLDSDPSVLIVCSGPGPERAQHAAQLLSAQGIDALLSFGVAGGLDPDLEAGAVIVAERVIGNTEMMCDADWSTQLLAAVRDQVGASLAPIAGVTDVARTPSRKAELYSATRTAVADMESYGIALAAKAANVRFAAIRVVCDNAHESIPPIAVAAMGENGEVRTLKTMAGAVLHPAQIPGLIRLGKRTARARTVLEALAGLCVPSLFTLGR